MGKYLFFRSGHNGLSPPVIRTGRHQSSGHYALHAGCTASLAGGLERSEAPVVHFLPSFFSAFSVSRPVIRHRSCQSSKAWLNGVSRSGLALRPLGSVMSVINRRVSASSPAHLRHHHRSNVIIIFLQSIVGRQVVGSSIIRPPDHRPALNRCQACASPISNFLSSPSIDI